MINIWQHKPYIFWKIRIYSSETSRNCLAKPVAQRSSGVCSSRFFIVRLAPCCTSSFASLRWSSSQAKCLGIKTILVHWITRILIHAAYKGVFPSTSAAETSTPAEARMAVKIEDRPKDAALCSAVAPLLSRIFTSAPSFRSFSTTYRTIKLYNQHIFNLQLKQTSFQPFDDASCKEEWPSWFLALILTPLLRSNATISVLPAEEARIKGVDWN
jgi:hypothetical protein